MELLRPFLSIWRMHLANALQYRAAVWAQLTTNIFWGFVRTVMMLVFYRYGLQQIAGYEAGLSLAQAVSHVWLVQIALHLLPGNLIDAEIREKIRSGDVALELCRPLDLYAHWFTRALAMRLGRFFLQLIPVTTVAMLLLPMPYRLQPPASCAGLFAFCASLLLGCLLSCALVGLSYVLLLRVSWGDGPVIILKIISDLLSGAELPLQLWPAWAQRLLAAQPFASLLDLPLRLYTGTLAPSEFWSVAAIQLAWLVLFMGVGWLLMQGSLRRLLIQGG
ncbi:MAG: hypothetical protein GX060_06050 [Firmicutes bacterium]|jgi:ABC-2 type transport system permease protein|nr:hypothetical protein [Bacillota bacterium]